MECRLENPFQALAPSDLTVSDIVKGAWERGMGEEVLRRKGVLSQDFLAGVDEMNDNIDLT